MYDTLLPLILVMLAIYLWQASLKARERARQLGHELCAQAHVQLLDQTVSLQRLRIERGSDGRLHWRRRYRFELSTDGVDRHQGTLDIMQDRLLGHFLPMLGASQIPVLQTDDDAAARSNVVAFPPRRTLH
ncbi:MAG: DUF3301 domain-containing protein [Rudaea sp.]